MLPAFLGFLTFLALLPGPRSGASSESEYACITYLGWVEPLGPWGCHRAAIVGAGLLVWGVSRQLLRWRAAGQTRRLLLSVTLLSVLGGAAVLTDAFRPRDQPEVSQAWTLDPEVGPGTGSGPTEVVTFSGATHCQWQTIVFLQATWPDDPDGPANPGVGTYLRDPDAVLDTVPLEGTLLLDTRLPDQAQDTGQRSGDVALWLGPDIGQDVVYVVDGERVERWPRAVNAPACA